MADILGKQKLCHEMIGASDLVMLDSHLSIAMACCKLFNHKVRSIAILQDGAIIGLVSDRDLVCSIIVAGLDPGITRLFDIASKFLHTLAWDASASEALEMMQACGYHHMLVERNGVVIGVLSLHDLVYEVRRSPVPASEPARPVSRAG
ncbi:MAG: CBS domain-containing protein [Rhodospirillaceae bacterium]